MQSPNAVKAFLEAKAIVQDLVHGKVRTDTITYRDLSW